MVGLLVMGLIDPDLEIHVNWANVADFVVVGLHFVVLGSTFLYRKVIVRAKGC